MTMLQYGPASALLMTEKLNIYNKYRYEIKKKVQYYSNKQIKTNKRNSE